MKEANEGSQVGKLRREAKEGKKEGRKDGMKEGRKGAKQVRKPSKYGSHDKQEKSKE